MGGSGVGGPCDFSVSIKSKSLFLFIFYGLVDMALLFGCIHY